jgi:hypothetical protein
MERSSEVGQSVSANAPHLGRPWQMALRNAEFPECSQKTRRGTPSVRKTSPHRRGRYMKIYKDVLLLPAPHSPMFAS